MGSGILYVAGVNVGLLNAAKLETTFDVLSIKADNGRLPAYKRINEAKLSAELYEVYLPNLSAIDTHGVLTSTAGTPVAVTNEAHGTGWTVGKPIKLDNKNGADTIVASIVVKSAGTTLTLATDYSTYVGDGTNGTLGYTYIVPVTAQVGAITVNYSYTPSVSKDITWSDVAKLVGYYEVKFENTDSNGKKFSITFPAGYSTSDLTMEFKSDETIDEAMTVPFEVTAFPSDTGVMFVIHDEQSVA